MTELKNEKSIKITKNKFYSENKKSVKTYEILSFFSFLSKKSLKDIMIR